MDDQITITFPHRPRHAAARRPWWKHLTARLGINGSSELSVGRTLRTWKDAPLAYFNIAGAINGIIELGRRTARGYRNPTNYQLRMLLIAAGLDASTHTQL